MIGAERIGSGGRWAGAAGFIYLALCYVFIFLPVAVLVLFSFHDGRVPVPPFEGPSLRWYEKLLTNDRAMAALGQSVLVAAGSALVSVALGFLAAFGLARYPVPFAGHLRAALVMPLTVSYLIIAIGLLIMFRALDIGPSLLAVAIGHVVINLPLAFAIIAAQMGEHQRRLELAARDLGASTPRVLAQITLPLIAPSLIAAFALCFTFSWDEFVIALLLTRFDVTLPVVIWNLLRSGLSPETNAAGTVVFAISVVLVIALELFVLRRSKA
jgi:spermidine/putrescine transport system permease protein